MEIELGATYPLATLVTDDSGNPIAATGVIVTVTLPDLTTATPAVSNPVLGTYAAFYPTTQAGRHVARWAGAIGAETLAMEEVFDVRPPTRVFPIATLAPFAVGQDIADRLGRDFTTAELAQASAFCSDASDLIRDYIRQDISAVTGDVTTREAPDGPWLDLPQRPVNAVTSVAINGHVVADFSQIGDRLYRLFGWRWPSVDTIPPMAIYGLKSTLSVIYNHGYTPIPDVIVAVCRRMAMRAFINPTGVTSLEETIDDYGNKVAYADRAGTGVNLTDDDRLSLRRYRRGAWSMDLGSGDTGGAWQ